jgi:hypothetical protein
MAISVSTGESDSLAVQKLNRMHHLCSTATAGVSQRKKVAEKLTKDDPVVVERSGTERRNGNGINE